MTKINIFVLVAFISCGVAADYIEARYMPQGVAFKPYCYNFIGQTLCTLDGSTYYKAIQESR